MANDAASLSRCDARGLIFHAVKASRRFIMTTEMRIREIDWRSAEQRRTDNVLHLFTGIDLIRESIAVQ